MILMAGGLEIAAKVFWYLLGYRNGDDDPSSRYRHLFSAAVILLIGLFILEAATTLSGEKAEAFAVLTVRIMILLSFVYFTAVVVVPTLFIRDSSFDLNPRRLIRDILISATYAIFAFALLYRQQGIVAGTGMETRAVFDTIYFSAVTFSTLGFGDFRPAASVRGYAAMQGLWGNIHLGLLAGAIFYAIQNRSAKAAPTVCKGCGKKLK